MAVDEETIKYLMFHHRGGGHRLRRTQTAQALNQLLLENNALKKENARLKRIEQAVQCLLRNGKEEG